MLFNQLVAEIAASRAPSKRTLFKRLYENISTHLLFISLKIDYSIYAIIIEGSKIRDVYIHYLILKFTQIINAPNL